MKIAIWKTDHEINCVVMNAVAAGFTRVGQEWTVYDFEDVSFEGMDNLVSSADVHISYGILRGTGDVFRECDRQGKPWIHLDRGYFNPGHYDGYYRVSLCGTQQTVGLDKLGSDGKRFDALGIEILPHVSYVGVDPSDHNILFCPPTEFVTEFFKRNIQGWYFNNLNPIGGRILREKGCQRPLEEDLSKCSEVVTFNSSIGWEALRRGIPVISDPIHSIVGAYSQKLVDKPLHLDIESRRKLFGIMGDLQMTLEEIRNGHLCNLLPKLLALHNPSKSTSVGTPAKPLQAKWPRTA